MKSYTDVEQSKKLAEILPIESADMTYDWAVIDNEWDVDGNTDHVAEELADVMVLWEHIRLYHGVTIQAVQGIMREKINRQLKRIEEKKK